MQDTPLIISVAFLWPHFSKTMSLLKSMSSLSRVPGPDLALQMSLLSVEHWEKNQLFPPAGNALFNAVQAGIGCLCLMETLPQGHFLVHPDHRSFFQSCFPVSLCPGAWGYFSPEAGLSISFCRTPQNFCQPISALVQVSLHGSTHLVYYPLFPVLFFCCALGTKQEASPSKIARLCQVKF